MLKSYRSETIKVRIRWWLALIVGFDTVSSFLYFLQYFQLYSFYFFLCIVIYMYLVKEPENVPSWLLAVCQQPFGNMTWAHNIWRYIFLVPMNQRMLNKSGKEHVKTNWKWVFIYSIHFVVVTFLKCSVGRVKYKYRLVGLNRKTTLNYTTLRFLFLAIFPCTYTSYTFFLK